MAEVWVYAEPKHGTFPRVTFEMLAAARRTMQATIAMQNANPAISVPSASTYR